MKRSPAAPGAHHALGMLLVCWITAAAVAAPPRLTELNQELRSVAEQVTPSVVQITTETAAPAVPEGLPLPGGPRFGQARGSGMLFRTDDRFHYVLTNAHVVQNARNGQVRVRLVAEREDRDGEVVGAYRLADTAVVKIPRRDGDNLPLVKFGSVDDLHVAELVLAIGSPFAFETSVTLGVVSGLNRELDEPAGEGSPSGTRVSFRGLIQVDAPINPGNSGGPLVNMNGEVIGVNFAIFSPGASAGNIGIGFAIPIDRAIAAANDLISEGRVRRGYMGVQIQSLEDVGRGTNGRPMTLQQMREFFGTDQGAYVAAVEPGLPAAQAGIQEGDVIVSFNRQPVLDSGALTDIVGSTRPGTAVPVEVMRDGQRLTLNITLAEMPATLTGGAPAPGETPPARRSDPLGLSVERLTPERARELGVEPRGVLVTATQPDSPLARLQAGSVLLSGRRAGAARVEFNTVEDWQRFIDAARGQWIQLRINLPLEDNQRQVRSIPVQVPRADDGEDDDR